ncbi:helix-turn-helix transcriptional regulator [Paenibacillus cymbidii]|uniref:helix-turn-helix transcriptional regulator n=1 Tax=Paenibacillus cymbidii TaxID=1639034 RepID=UPI001082136C|nr:helix-turn-helix transcriptional regulator [Paenibacillus cymbidii]
MQPKENDSSRGIVHAAAGREKFALARFEPASPLQPFIEHYWIIHYDLPDGMTHTQTVLSYPNVHLAFERDESGSRALLYGVPSRPFVRVLRGAGKVLGVKFRAGGFYPFWRRDVAQLTGKTVPAADIFGPVADDWLAAVFGAGSDEEMAAQAERALLARLPDRDAQGERTARIVADTMTDRSIIKVEQLCEQSGLSVRQLQRLFGKYVGVTPKWVIKRFRLQEAAERMENDESAQWADLAAQLGYFDQAHFSKDFKSVLGQTPATYRKNAALR